MAQANYTPKHLVTAITGTAGVVFSAAGRAISKAGVAILTWYQKVDADIPATWVKFAQSGDMYNKGGKSGWSSKTTIDAPVMKLISGDAFGYTAAPEVAGRDVGTLTWNRCSLTPQTTAIRNLQLLCTMILENPALQQQIVGYTPADV